MVPPDSASPVPRVVVCLRDFAVWMMRHTNRFPKNWRVTLGDRLDRLLLDMVTTAHLAAFRARKKDLLIRLSEDLETLRVLIRLCHELGCFPLRQLEFSAARLDEVGRQLGGWLKQRAGEK